MDPLVVRERVAAFQKLKIAVLGDFMLDRFIWGRVDRISPEAPVPVVFVVNETASLGGAGNVVQNLLSMGASVLPIGAVGQDEAGAKIRELLGNAESIITVKRPTTVKTRIIAHQQQVVRVDTEETALFPEDVQDELAGMFFAILDSVDAVIISDYSKGCISPRLLSAILPESKRRQKIVCLDPKTRYFPSYSPVTILTPNQSEASAVLGYPIVTEEELRDAGRKILQMIDCKALLITRGEKGMALFDRDKVMLVPARAREVFDVTGAGDTVISVLALALAAGMDFPDAVELTNIAAGIVVGKLGTASVTPDELLNQ